MQLDQTIMERVQRYVDTAGETPITPSDVDYLLSSLKITQSVWRERTELLVLAECVNHDFEDAADWKDAKPHLQAMARIALKRAGVL